MLSVGVVFVVVLVVVAVAVLEGLDVALEALNFTVALFHLS